MSKQSMIEIINLMHCKVGDVVALFENLYHKIKVIKVLQNESLVTVIFDNDKKEYHYDLTRRVWRKTEID